MLFFRLLKEHANVYALCNAYSNVLLNFNALMYALKSQSILACVNMRRCFTLRTYKNKNTNHTPREDSCAHSTENMPQHRQLTFPEP